MRKTLIGVGLVLSVAGCQAPLLPSVSPVHQPTTSAGAPDEQGRVAVTIQWPYRTQVIPTSTEKLRLTLAGPTSQTIDILRPDGGGPTSTASLTLDVGTGYTLAIDALARQNQGELDPTLLVASGQSDPFEVAANKVTSVRVALSPSFMPAILDFSPTNGGPGTYVTVQGLNFGRSRDLTLGFRFGGTVASIVHATDDGTASVLVPDLATSSLLFPVTDGVTGLPSGSFTVLSQLGIQPAASTVASGSTFLFTAQATSTEGSEFASPNVQWYLSTSSIGAIDASGTFSASGSGTGEVVIYSGRLLATASITVP